MDNWRRSRYGRRPGSRIYIPSSWTPSESRDRFHRRNILDGGQSSARDRYIREALNGQSQPEPPRRRERFPSPAQDEYIPHPMRSKRTAAGPEVVRIPAPDQKAAPEPSAPPVPQYSVPVYPCYPAAPAYFPPPYPDPYVMYDRYGRPLSEAEMAEIDAFEAYEDRYGRDFDRYTSGGPTPAKKPPAPAPSPDTDSTPAETVYLEDDFS